MNPTTHATEVYVSAPVLYMALELSNRSWRLAFGDGAQRRFCRVASRYWWKIMADRKQKKKLR